MQISLSVLGEGCRGTYWPQPCELLIECQLVLSSVQLNFGVSAGIRIFSSQREILGKTAK